MKNPKILVFDEATSSLDSQTEKLIQESFDEICKGRSTLIVAHRLSTIIHANTILVLKDGRIVEKGTHDYLLSIKGHYSQMWNIQQSSSDKHELM